MYEQLSLMTCPMQTSGASAFRAKTSASQGSKKACKKVSEADCFTKLCDCLPAVGKKIDLNGCSLKMLKIYLALETDLISRGCCVKWGGHGYSLQWDTLNSKNFGVPQNRERVFIVGYLGNIRGREVFPLQRTDGENPCKLKEITQGVADAQRIYDGGGLARTLKGESGGQGGKTGLYAVRFRYTERGEKSREKGRMEHVEIANALTSKHCGDQTADCSNGVVCMSIKGQKLQKQINVSQTLDSSCRNNLLQKQTCCAVLTPNREEKRQNGRRIKEPGEPSFTLTAQDRHGVAIFDDQGRKNKQLKPMDICPTLRAQSHGNEPKVFGDNVRIRRLTPRECWRLQGFPDEYFDKAKAAGISDTQLYKQAGNSVSVPVAKAIGVELRRIELCQGDTNNLKITD